MSITQVVRLSHPEEAFAKKRRHASVRAAPARVIALNR